MSNTNPTLASIAIDRIYVSETAAQNARRKRFDKRQLKELSDSIRTYGVLQPIIVRARQTKGGFSHELVAGERRFLAAQTANLEEIPAVVRELTDEQVIEVQLIENLQRADIHPMEEAEGYQQLMKVHGHPVEELHTRVGKSRSYVYGRLKLLALNKTGREAFYAGEISASIALLIARIPGKELQEKALKAITSEWRPLNYREASEWIQRECMLLLKDAPFPTDDAKLNGAAGPCSNCPKRTGNQPELFGDVQSADVCTDPVCFREKTIAFGNRAMNEAMDRGQVVLAGAKAKQIAPHGAERSLKGWHRLDEKDWNVGKTIRQIVGKDAERALLQCPETGVVVEVVPEAAVQKALKAKGKGKTTSSNPQTVAERKRKLERLFRRELYAQVRPKLPAPTPQLLAAVMLKRLHHETLKDLCAIRAYEPPVEKRYGRADKDWSAVGKDVEHWTDAVAWEFINDMIYASELSVSTYGNSKPEQLLEAAKIAGVDAAAVRRELVEKKKTKKAMKGKGAGARKKAA